MLPIARLAASLVALGLLGSGPDEATGPATVATIQARHDRALIRDLVAYLANDPKAADADQAYLSLFDKAIEHDWFLDHEPVAKAYLKDYPDGPVRPLAQIIATMARAEAGKFDEALANFRVLMDGIGGGDQVEFATNFADNLADAAIAAGEVETAKRVCEIVLKKFGEVPAVKQEFLGHLDRLARVGKAAPTIAGIADIDGKAVRFEDLRGSYVLVDFWATWCSPCLADLPKLQAVEATYRAKGLKVVGVSLDETKGPVVDFVRVRKLPWTQVHNATCSGDLVAAFGVNTIPATFLIDPKGTIVRLDLRGASLEKAFESLLK